MDHTFDLWADLRHQDFLRTEKKMIVKDNPSNYIFISVALVLYHPKVFLKTTLVVNGLGNSLWEKNENFGRNNKK